MLGYSLESQRQGDLISFQAICVYDDQAKTVFNYHVISILSVLLNICYILSKKVLHRWVFG